MSRSLRMRWGIEVTDYLVSRELKRLERRVLGVYGLIAFLGVQVEFKSVFTLVYHS